MMIELPSRPIKFNRQSPTGRNSGHYPKKESKPEAVPDSKNNGISDRPSEHSQRAVLSTQQVIGKDYRAHQGMYP